MSTVFLMKPNCIDTMAIYHVAGELTEREQRFLAPIQPTAPKQWVVQHNSEGDYRFKHLFELDYNCTRYHYRGVYGYFKGDVTVAEINAHIDELYAIHGVAASDADENASDAGDDASDAEASDAGDDERARRRERALRREMRRATEDMADDNIELSRMMTGLCEHQFC